MISREAVCRYGADEISSIHEYYFSLICPITEIAHLFPEFLRIDRELSSVCIVARIVSPDIVIHEKLDIGISNTSW